MRNYRITTCMTTLLILILTAGFSSLHAEGSQILSHGNNNTPKTDPKDLQNAPGVDSKKVKAKIPGPAGKPNGMVPVASIDATVAFTAHETNGTWRWNAMLQNTHPGNPFPASRLRLKVVQLTGIPNQTLPAGSEFPLPALSPQQKRGFSSTWNRTKDARKLRLEIWDTRTHTVIYDQELALATKADALTNLPISAGSQRFLENMKNIERSKLVIDGGKYLGRGAWEVDVSSSGKGGVPAGLHAYTWIYQFSAGPDRTSGVPKDIAFDIPPGQQRTILEPGQLYTASEGDCATLDTVAVSIEEKATGKMQTIDIHVAVPNVEIWRFWLKPSPGSAVLARPMADGRVFTSVTNHSHYNLLLEWQL